MPLLIRRMPALLLIFALAAGDVALCAGWMATSEARMSCCEDGTCPMHRSDSRKRFQRATTQAEADSCCAAAEAQHSRQPASAPAVPMSSAVLELSFVLPAGTPELVLEGAWRLVPPLPPDAVPRHVLLSVFLV